MRIVSPLTATSSHEHDGETEAAEADSGRPAWFDFRAGCVLKEGVPPEVPIFFALRTLASHALGLSG